MSKTSLFQSMTIGFIFCIFSKIWAEKYPPQVSKNSSPDWIINLPQGRVPIEELLDPNQGVIYIRYKKAGAKAAEEYPLQVSEGRRLCGTDLLQRVPALKQELMNVIKHGPVKTQCNFKAPIPFCDFPALERPKAQFNENGEVIKVPEENEVYGEVIFAKDEKGRYRIDAITFDYSPRDMDVNLREQERAIARELFRLKRTSCESVASSAHVASTPLPSQLVTVSLMKQIAKNPTLLEKLIDMDRGVMYMNHVTDTLEDEAEIVQAKRLCGKALQKKLPSLKKTLTSYLKKQDGDLRCYNKPTPAACDVYDFFEYGSHLGILFANDEKLGLRLDAVMLTDQGSASEYFYANEERDLGKALIELDQKLCATSEKN